MENEGRIVESVRVRINPRRYLTWPQEPNAPTYQAGAVIKMSRADAERIRGPVEPMGTAPCITILGEED